VDRTPKERVLEKWPDAECRYGYIAECWKVWTEGGKELGYGDSARAAWQDAARRLK